MLRRYLSNLRAVNGWLEPFSAKFIGQIGAIQQRADVVGGAAEIGVHHGKLFLVLHNACPGLSLAIDIFEDQHLNTDGSGKGSRSRFEANVARWGDPSRLRIISGSSLELTPEQIRQQVGEVVLFSVDGGHTAQCTLNDLLLAEATLAKKGVVVIDDVFNSSWPDVVTGFSQYLASGGLRPFAITPNKVYLTRPENIEFYRQELRARFAADADKESQFFGVTVDLYGLEARATPIRTAMLKHAKGSPFYPLVRSARRALLPT